MVSRDAYYNATSPLERATWLLYFNDEPTTIELLDLHFAQLAWMIATTNSTGTKFDLDSFRIIKPAKKPKTTEELGALLLHHGNVLKDMANRTK